MFDRQEHENYLELIDRHIDDLQKRINVLKGRISVMDGEGYNTQPQAQLLTNMQTIMQTIQMDRLKTLEALKIGDNRVNPRRHGLT